MISKQELQSLQQGHRTRLREKFLAGQLSDSEILELLLTYAIPRRDVHMLAKQLYKKYENIHMILAAPTKELIKFNGIKENTVTFFRLIHKITEMHYRVTFDETPIFHNHERLTNYCKLLLADKKVEELHVFYLDAKYRLLEDELHSTGTIDKSSIYERDIIKKALTLDAHYIVFLHNHPSGYTSFSSEDIETTQRLADAFIKFDIKIYDHLLVSGDVVYSARNMGLYQ